MSGTLCWALVFLAIAGDLGSAEDKRQFDRLKSLAQQVLQVALKAEDNLDPAVDNGEVDYTDNNKNDLQKTEMVDSDTGFPNMGFMGFYGMGHGLKVCPEEALRCNSKGNIRSVGGECNNLFRPNWGSAFSAVEDLLPKDLFKFSVKTYFKRPGIPSEGATCSGCQKFNECCCPKDCPAEGCQSHRSRLLPNARTVSTTVAKDANKPEPNFSLMLMQFGQFLDHDISLSEQSKVKKPCCNGNPDPECLPIGISPSDTFYSQYSQTCMEFTRTPAFCPKKEEACQSRKPFSVLTSFLDLSQVYGSEEKLANELRSFVDGKMKVGPGNSLPFDSEGNLLVGDIRAGDMPGLASMHTIFIREHNRICDLLNGLGIHLTEEEVYQNARRINYAQWQKIVYGDYLPLVLGSDAMTKFGLELNFVGSTYDPTQDPSILNSFSTAAFRFGHSLIQGIVKLAGPAPNSYFLSDTFFNNSVTLNRIEDLLASISGGQECQQYDRFITSEVTNKLFKEEKPFGMDLVALNIQRGRDHGLQGYSEYYRLFSDDDGNEDMSCWERKPSTMSKASWELLRSLYLHPKDIDLFAAGLLEKSPPGAVVSFTFQNIIAEQFKRIKDGDRFFFTHLGQTGKFKLRSIMSFMRRTLRDIICENTDIKQLPTNVFLLADNGVNRPFKCKLTNKLRVKAVNLITPIVEPLL